MTRRALLRASDADREQIAERIRQAATEGRLLPDELEDRIETALSARTYGELDALVADLPAPPAVHPRRSSRSVGLLPAVAVACAFGVVLMLIGMTGWALGHHPGPGRHWLVAGRGASLIWLLWIVIALRFVFSRRGGAR